MIVLASLFRNATHLLPRYFAQVEALSAVCPDLHALLVWGDSTDSTRRELVRYASEASFPSTIVEASHGGPVFGSVEQPARMRQLSVVFNCLLDAVPRAAETVIYVECDLVWEPDALLALMGGILFDVQAPLILSDIVPTSRKRFYDTWAFRHGGGRRFVSDETFPSSPFEVSSVGSCLAMRGEVARQVRVLDDNAIVGWCQRARDMGYTIGVSPTIRVEHPSE